MVRTASCVLCAISWLAIWQAVLSPLQGSGVLSLRDQGSNALRPSLGSLAPSGLGTLVSDARTARPAKGSLQAAIDPAVSATLPAGVRAVWDVGKAWHETTPTRERICLNGLWRWQPALSSPLDTHTGVGYVPNPAPPRTGWGWFKVPGPWPGIQDYMQKDCQTVIANDEWKTLNLSQIRQAWYEREITVPSGWNGRHIAIQASYVNSLARCFIDRKSVGTIAFPGGEVDLTGKVGPGNHTLAILVTAAPLKAVLQSYANTNTAVPVEGNVPRRGLCGDVFLVGTPRQDRIDDAAVETSVQKGTIAVRGTVEGAYPYSLRAEILDNGEVIESFSSQTAAPALLTPTATRPFFFQTNWRPNKLWDIDTPQNQFELRLTLLGANGKVEDRLAPIKFGFRELWVKGPDFMLNDSRIFLSELPLENAGISAGLASYEGAKETLTRLKEDGINMVYMHNYDCNPGDYLSFDEILRAADDVGMLVALTMPHFGDYDWSAPDADAHNGYARHAKFFASVAGSHPSVVFYSTSHNATGYNEDTNPDMMDGLAANRDNWASNNVKKALRAEAIIHSLDPSRIVYHHSGGSLGSIYTVNFYLNFLPPQEMDDWFEHWATAGVKPMFLVEYGVPFSWDWTMYRGYYNGQRHFGEAQAQWEYCMAEWNAQFLGDEAYNISEAEKRNLRWEAPLFAANKTWYRWDYPYPPGTVNPDFEEQQKVWAQYTTENWRAFRTWGVSGISPWEIYGTFFQLRPDVNRNRVDLKTDWDSLQRPGYSPDYIDGRYERRDTAYEVSDWAPTTGGKALLRNGSSCLAYIAGKPGAFTSKDHIFHPGEKVEKQIVLINNSRRTVHCEVFWSADLPDKPRGLKSVDLPTGEIRFLPLALTLPSSLSPGVGYKISLTVHFGPQDAQDDEFDFRVLPRPPAVSPFARLAIYDPVGQTTELLASLGVTGTPVGAGADLSGFDTVIVGKNALTVDGPGPDLSDVKNGQKVIVFEQTSDVLEKRLGFRVEEYGLRNVFPRVAGSPVLRRLDPELLRDWRGSATLLPPRLKTEPAQQFYGAPSVVRTGMVQTRVWRCGTRGTVADVLIEKPARGDFLPIVDGGFSLEYSPLLECREGHGMVVFCQMDVTGRTEEEPAAERLVANLLNYVKGWKPAPEYKSVEYIGDEAGRSFLAACGVPVADSADFSPLLVLGPGAERGPDNQRALIRAYRNEMSAPQVIAIGLPGDEVKKTSVPSVPTRPGEYIQSGPIPDSRAFEGIGPADIYSHAPVEIPLLSQGCPALGVAGDRTLMFQLVPWSFDVSHQNTKRTFRRASFVLSRLLGNLGVHGQTPLLQRLKTGAADNEKRWLSGFYLDTPELVDDPYRFFGW